MSAKKAFTLIELLVVMGIMGLMGTVAVGGYRAMQRGMEERGVVQNVNHFVRAAYQRAVMDRQPVNVYFWNETIRDESDVDTLVVVGKAVAVRRCGRLTAISGGSGKGSVLIDEFGDLRFSRLVVDEDDDEEETSSRATDAAGNGMYLYRLTDSGSSFQRSIVSRSTRPQTVTDTLVTTGEEMEITTYGYVMISQGTASNWQVGDAYGFEMAEIQLPENYIFGSSFSTSINNPVGGTQLMTFGADGAANNDTIQINSLRPNSSGELTAQRVATSNKPSADIEY